MSAAVDEAQAVMDVFTETFAMQSYNWLYVSLAGEGRWYAQRHGWRLSFGHARRDFTRAELFALDELFIDVPIPEGLYRE